MSGKKGMKHYGIETAAELTRLKEQGMSYLEIGQVMGLCQAQVTKYFERQRKRERAIATGYIPKPKGRPRKANTPAERIWELEREVELLRAFLHAAGRM